MRIMSLLRKAVFGDHHGTDQEQIKREAEEHDRAIKEHDRWLAEQERRLDRIRRERGLWPR